MAIKLIIGLRNPGKAYESTRHNVGEWFVAALALRHRVFFKLEKKMQAELADLALNQQQGRLVLPITWMNHSGQATRLVSQFYKIEPEEILVVHDELDLAAGRIKLKSDGGHGGHNGLRDIIAQLGSTKFHRLRIGIGHPGHRDLVLQFVLGKPSTQDKLLIDEAIDRGVSTMPLVFSDDLARAMSQLNT